MSPIAVGLARYISTHRRGWEFLCNLTLGLFYLLFDIRMMVDFRLTHRMSSLLLMIFETLVVFYAFSRPMPKESNTSLYDWTVALLGTLIGVLLRPATEISDSTLLLTVQSVGMGISLIALCSLNRSWGLVAANRGVKTGGLYGLIRHPIYAGYFLSIGAFVLQNLTALNALIYALFVGAELLRIVAEERLLSSDPTYAAYAQRTPWRILPFIY